MNGERSCQDSSPGRPARMAAGGLACALLVSGCATPPRPGALAPRKGDEIVVAGRFVHTGTRVVLWLDPGGYDAYRVERRFSPMEQSGWADSQRAVPALQTPNRYGLRQSVLTEAEAERVRGGGWDLPLLQKVVDQFVIHYDAAGTSRQCFKVLHDLRGLSVHFLLDLDGTIYQTLDLKERAWHATLANSRSVGVEIAHLGAFRPDRPTPLADWYCKDERGRVRLRLPERLGDGGLRTPNFVGRPARPEPVRGVVQGMELLQYDFTPEQYEALARLVAALCAVFPKLRCDYPRDASGRLIPRKLTEAEYESFRGLLGHFHIQSNKVDPGPAFQWEWVRRRALRLLARRPALRGDKPAAQLLSWSPAP